MAGERLTIGGCGRRRGVRMPGHRQRNKRKQKFAESATSSGSHVVPFRPLSPRVVSCLFPVPLVHYCARECWPLRLLLTPPLLPDGTHTQHPMLQRVAVVLVHVEESEGVGDAERHAQRVGKTDLDSAASCQAQVEV